MKIVVTKEQVDNLKLDAKTLVDISRLLEMDGRFKFTPLMLDSIAADIQMLFKTKAEKKMDEMVYSIDLLEEVIDSARVQKHEPDT